MLPRARRALFLNYSVRRDQVESKRLALAPSQSGQTCEQHQAAFGTCRRMRIAPSTPPIRQQRTMNRLCGLWSFRPLPRSPNRHTEIRSQNESASFRPPYEPGQNRHYHCPPLVSPDCFRSIRIPDFTKPSECQLFSYFYIFTLTIIRKSVLLTQEDLLCPYCQSFSVLPTAAEATTHRKGPRPAPSK